MKNIVKLLIFVILVGCIYDDNKPLKSGRVMASMDDPDDPFDTIGKKNNTNVQVIGGVTFIGQVTAKPDPEGDTNYWSIADQTIAGAYGITHRFGFIHIIDNELAKGRHLVTVKLYDKNDTTVFSTKDIAIFGYEDGGGIVGCDTIIQILDSTWIPPIDGYWKIDTNFFRLVPKCYDTIPIERL